jgi:thiol-disulfide isomerase/thioredoxin
MPLMKSITFLLVFCLVIIAGCKTSRPVAQINKNESQKPESMTDNTHQAVNYSEQSTWLLGYFNPVQLKREPHSVWFYKGYDEYQPAQEAINSLNGINREGLTIKIVLGTWCPDSRREVPRFMKVIDTWKFPSDLVTFIGVDNEKNSPIGGYGELDIQRVPTFIIYKNNIETGRIIENPATSLEQDMVNILGGMKNNK